MNVLIIEHKRIQNYAKSISNFESELSKSLRIFISGFADGWHEVSPDSEEIEQTWTEGSIAKLSERGANPRRGLWGGVIDKMLSTSSAWQGLNFCKDWKRIKPSERWEYFW